MEETARAKINLALHVRARGADGYHRIETLFAFTEHGDALRAEPYDRLVLRIEGPFAGAVPQGDDNLILRAAHALRARGGIDAGAALTLDKRLPVAAGLGGGSADAAAALRLLAGLWDLGADRDGLLEIARGLGADVPACLYSCLARGEGKGDDVRPLDGSAMAGLPLLLVNPRIALSTRDVFLGWDGLDRGPLDDGPPLAAAIKGRNDLQPAALALAPAIGDVLAGLEAARGVRLVRMSGSGATCFALFDEDAQRDAAAGEIAAARPDWWQLSTRIAAGACLR